MKRFPLILVLCVGFIATASAQYRYPFQNPALPAKERIDNALSLMTLQEKIDLLGMTLNVPRLGIHASGAVPTIPGSNGQIEGLHGVAMGGVKNWGRRSPGGAGGEYPGISPIPTTQFPEAAGLAETWDPALLQKIAAQEGYEARFIFQSYDRGGLTVRAPNADLARDPRWGRFEESYGEDPYLTGVMATAFVRGLQGVNPHYWLTASLLKHFMANSNEDNRASSSSNFDATLLHEYYAAPFRMAIEKGGADAIMASYNAVNGIPMTANHLLRNLVMKQWGLDGIVDSDRGAVTNLVTKHKYYPDMDHAVAGALLAGVNQFLNLYEPWIREDLQRHLITEADIDRNVRGVLRILLRLGMLDGTNADPYLKIKKGLTPTPWKTQTAKDLALRATEESVVLLKNAPVVHSAPLLPLDVSKLKSIAVIGPRADEVDADGYGGTPPFAITPLAGIRNRAGDKIEVRYSADYDQAMELARTSDVAVVVIGNMPMWSRRMAYDPNPSEGKEGVDRQQIVLNPEQQKLVEGVYAANPRTVVVLVSGFPYAIDWSQQHVPAIIHMSPSSEEEGAALADVLFGDYNPAGRLAVTWPRSVDQLPPMMDYNIRDGSTYMYFKGKPLYPFGYGLSYTKFRYSHLSISSNDLSSDGEVIVTTNVTNTGTRNGGEVVQMYVQHLDSRVARPRKELKGFERVFLKAGEKKTIHFTLPAKALGYWDQQNSRWLIEHDHVRVMIGNSSTDIKESCTLLVSGTALSAQQSSPGYRWIIGGRSLDGGVLDTIRIQQLDPVLAKAYFDNNGTFIQSSYSPNLPAGWSAIPEGHFASYAKLKTAIDTGAIHSAVIPNVMFDDENWRLTPIDEQQNPVGYMNDFVQAAHDNGFTTIMAPDQNLASPKARITDYQGGETTNWQTYLRLGLGAQAAASGTDGYHIMAQSFEASWGPNPEGDRQGSEADFLDYITQAALQAKSVNPHLKMTIGLSTNKRYSATPQALYQDTLDASNIFLGGINYLRSSQVNDNQDPIYDRNATPPPGYWLNIIGSYGPSLAVQYLEMLSGMVPLYLRANHSLNLNFPKGSTPDTFLLTPGASVTFVSSTTFPAGATIPTGSYKFEPWTDGNKGSDILAIDVGYCTPPSCANPVSFFRDQSRSEMQSPWNANIAAGDPGITSTFTTSSPTRLPAGGPYNIYVTIAVKTSTAMFNLLYDAVSKSTNLALPRPSSLSVVPNTTVLFTDAGGRMEQNKPIANNTAQFNLDREGATLTFSTPKAFTAGQVIPPGAWEYQFWTDGTSNNQATLKLEFGYCASFCTVKTPIINSRAGWNPTIKGASSGIATQEGAFTTTSPTTLPPGGPYQLYFAIRVQNPGPFHLLYGSAIAPTNVATPFVIPNPHSSPSR